METMGFWCHPWLISPSVYSTRKLIASKFVWHGLNKQVSIWAKACILCQASQDSAPHLSSAVNLPGACSPFWLHSCWPHRPSTTLRGVHTLPHRGQSFHQVAWHNYVPRHYHCHLHPSISHTLDLSIWNSIAHLLWQGPTVHIPTLGLLCTVAGHPTPPYYNLSPAIQ